MQSTLAPPQSPAETTTRRPPNPTDAHAPKRLPVLDLAGIAGLSAVIAIHTAELSGKVEETAYLGLGYIALIMASVMSIALLAQHDRRGWILARLTAAATMIGFVITRTTGLPNARGDIGNWSETIAVWSLIAEGLVILISTIALHRARHRQLQHRSV